MEDAGGMEYQVDALASVHEGSDFAHVTLGDLDLRRNRSAEAPLYEGTHR
jgi:hypothetical protein